MRYRWLRVSDAVMNSFLLLSNDSRPLVPPTRDEVLTARVGFQGVTIQTQQYGAIKAWGPEIGSLTDTDRASYVRQMITAGFNACEVAVSWNYPVYPIGGRDLSQNLTELRRQVKQIITVGGPIGLKAVLVFCAGDGLSVNPNPQPGQYNDPGGWTYGREWLLHNFSRIYAAFGPQSDDPIDLRPWVVFVPGYDACDAYQWDSGANVVEVWHLMRLVVDAGGAGYVGFEWPAGQCQLGDGFPTYTQANAGCIDLWLLETPAGPYPPSDDNNIRQLTQQVGRMCRPYNRPAWAVDDPSPPFYGPFNTPRGPAPVQLYEHSTYDWTHGASVELVQQKRAVLQLMAPGTILC